MLLAASETFSRAAPSIECVTVTGLLKKVLTMRVYEKVFSPLPQGRAASPATESFKHTFGNLSAHPQLLLSSQKKCVMTEAVDFAGS